MLCHHLFLSPTVSVCLSLHVVKDALPDARHSIILHINIEQELSDPPLLQVPQHIWALFFFHCLIEKALVSKNSLNHIVVGLVNPTVSLKTEPISIQTVRLLISKKLQSILKSWALWPLMVILSAEKRLENLFKNQSECAHTIAFVCPFPDVLCYSGLTFAWQIGQNGSPRTTPLNQFSHIWNGSSKCETECSKINFQGISYWIMDVPEAITKSFRFPSYRRQQRIRDVSSKYGNKASVWFTDGKMFYSRYCD